MVDCLTCVSYYGRPFVIISVSESEIEMDKEDNSFSRLLLRQLFVLFLEIVLELKISVLLSWVCKHLYKDHWYHLLLHRRKPRFIRLRSSLHWNQPRVPTMICLLKFSSTSFMFSAFQAQFSNYLFVIITVNIYIHVQIKRLLSLRNKICII